MQKNFKVEDRTTTTNRQKIIAKNRTRMIQPRTQSNIFITRCNSKWPAVGNNKPDINTLLTLQRS